MTNTMTHTTVATTSQRRHPLMGVLVGGLISGTLDLIAAYLTFGRDVPRGIARGLIGSSAFQGGFAPYVLGLALHFFIAFSAAAIYYAASRKLDFLIGHPIVCGLFYGIAIFLVMNLVVLPLSMIHFRGPFSLQGLITGLVAHMLIIGLPITLSVSAFARKKSD